MPFLASNLVPRREHYRDIFETPCTFAALFPKIGCLLTHFNLASIPFAKKNQYCANNHILTNSSQMFKAIWSLCFFTITLVNMNNHEIKELLIKKNQLFAYYCTCIAH
jgi:hypothetical protein